jgi:hypothetical protein
MKAQEFAAMAGVTVRALHHHDRVGRALHAIAAAEREPTPALLKSIIEAIEMPENTNWTEKYYSAEARAKIDARRQNWTPELQAQCEKDWRELIAEAEGALGEDPSSERAQALAKRWRALVEGFTGGDREVTEGLKKVYADQANWPAAANEQMKPFRNPAVWAFMAKAMECGK